MRDDIFYLNTLGVHSIRYRGVTLTAEELKSDKVVQLITFLISNRGSTVEYSTFARELWLEGEIENFKSALKNLVYRARKALKTFFGEEEDFILQTGLGYRWNDEIEVIWDAQLFEQLIKDSRMEENTDISARLLRQAIDMYKGDCLVRFQEYLWVSLLTSYYHGLYLMAVKRLCKIDLNQRNFKEIYTISKTTLSFELLDEDIYCYLIQAITELDGVWQGLDAYDQIHRYLVGKIGTDKFVKLRQVHTWLLNLESDSEAKDMQEILQELDVHKESHPFFCNYGIFREIYSITLKQSRRRHDVAAFMLLTVELPFDPSQGAVERHLAKLTMKHLEEAMYATLRESDVVCKFSEFQYVGLLFNCSEDDLPKVVNRIKDYFKTQYGKTAHAIVHETHTFL